MGFFGRVFGSSTKVPRTTREPSVEPPGAREYAFWLNDSLTRRAESGQEVAALFSVLLPILTRIKDTDETLPNDEIRRLINVNNRLVALYKEAADYLPPMDLALSSEWRDWDHQTYVGLLDTYLQQMRRLLLGFGEGADTEVMLAFSDLTMVAVTMGDLHDLVMERIISSLPASQQAAARQRVRAASSKGAAESAAVQDHRPPADFYEDAAGGG